MSTYDECITLDAKQDAVRPVRTAGGLAAVTRLLARVFWEWPERARQRRNLAALDDRMLSDIGISRSDVDTEFRKAPWHR